MTAVTSGILNVLKPPGMTSFDVVAWARRAANLGKVGHCGTLDPDAAGVLPLCVGAATGMSAYLTDTKKRYRVEAVPGLLTDTLDTSGTVLARDARRLPDRDVFEAALEGFLGPQTQIPPMHSAVKSGGQRLYKLARKGVEVEREPRPIEIFELRIINYGADAVIFDVACSKGTYVRSLCGDIGARLGMYLCMSFLLRTESAGLAIADALTLERINELVDAGRLGDALLPVDALLGAYAAAELPAGLLARYENGADVSLSAGAVSAPPRPDAAGVSTRGGADSGDVALARVYCQGRFLGLGALTADGRGGFGLRAKKAYRT